MLEIRTFRSKSGGICVELHRKYKHFHTVTRKAIFSYKQIGSFPLAEGYKGELLELLAPEEVLQLQNWLSEVSFGEHFEAGEDELTEFTIRIPQKVYDAITNLYVKAKQVGINFIPNQVMLESLINKAKLVQHKLNKINGFNTGILEVAGINSEQFISKDVEQKLLDIESRALFKVCLD